VRAISTAVAHFLHTEGVTGSNPVSPISDKIHSCLWAGINWAATALPQASDGKSLGRRRVNLAKTFKKTETCPTIGRADNPWVQSSVLPSSPGTNPSPPELMALAAAITQARLAAGLSAAALAKRLNMGVEQLEALESGDLELLPEQVFVIAQARRIAQNLGVTIDAEIQALRQSGSLNTRSIELQNLKLKADLEAPRGPEANQAPRANGMVPVLASLALASGLAAGGFALWQQWQGRQQQAIQPKPVLTKPVEVKPAQPKPAPTKKATTKQAQAAAKDQALAQTGATSLTLSTGSNTWLEVKTLKGKQLFRGDFKGRKGFPLNDGLRVLAGRPDRLLVQVGGTTARPLGPISEVKWQTFAAPKAPALLGTVRRPLEPRPGKPPGSNAPG